MITSLSFKQQPKRRCWVCFLKICGRKKVLSLSLFFFEFAENMLGEDQLKIHKMSRKMQRNRTLKFSFLLQVHRCVLVYIHSVVLLNSVLCFSVHVGNKPRSEPEIDKLHFCDNKCPEIFSKFTLFMGDFCQVNIFFYIAVINMWINRKGTLQIDIHPSSFGLVRTEWFFSSVLACFGSEYWLFVFLSDCIGIWLWSS